MDAATLIGDLRLLRLETLRRGAALDPARLGEQHEWRGKPAPLIFLLSWLAEADDTRRVRVDDTRARLAAPPTVAQRALVTAGETRGRLLGALVGLPEALFDQPPAQGEWSVREILAHVIATDKRYLIGTEYAIERARSGAGGPLRPPDALLPPRTGEAERPGAPAAVLARLTATRDDLTQRLGATPDDLLDAPTNWTAWDLDVRFRIHRFAAHDREHLIQLRKTLHALAFAQNEPQLLLADAQAVRGAIEAQWLLAPAALLEREPPGGGPTIAAISAAALSEEQALLAAL